MDGRIDASKLSTKYASAAHKLGMTSKGIFEDIITHLDDHFTEEKLGDILNGIGRIPKLSYSWDDPAIKASNSQNTLSIRPRNPWTSRFILTCGVKSETNSTIFAKMQRRGYDIPGENFVEVVLQEYIFIEKGLAHACRTDDGAALEMLILKAYRWGYTVLDIAGQICANTVKLKSLIQIKTMIQKTLESDGIPVALLRKGRDFTVTAQEFVLCAYNVGMEVTEIRDRMFAHGFSYFDPFEPNPFVDFLKEKWLYQGQEHLQTKLSQAAQPRQPSARDHVLPGKTEIAVQSVLARQEPIRRIDVMDLLNQNHLSPS